MSIVQQTLDHAIALHKQKDFAQAGHIYNCLLNRSPFEISILYLLSDVYLRQDYTGLAVNLLTNLLDKKPDHAEAWCNLGIAFRKENRYKEAMKAWDKALELQDDTVEVCSNYAGLYADRGQPLSALKWIRRALDIDPENTEAHWLKALSLLTLGKWAEGWPEYEYRKRLENFDTRASIDVPWWDWNYTDHLYIHGEQGVGDEIMFLSCLDEVLPLVGRVSIEVNPKVAPIVERTWPKITTITEPRPGDYTAKIGLGSLAGILRTNASMFPGTPYLKPDPARVESYRRMLSRVGPRPWLALTWLGGSKWTRVEDRSVTLEALKPIMEHFTCVSGQYEHTNPHLGAEREQHGLVKLDGECIGTNLAAQAALFAAVDGVVTVQQTAVHVAGAVGAKTYALIGSQPHWRYGTEGEVMPWYKSVCLYRNTDNDWARVINNVRRDIAYQQGIRGTESADARAA